MKKTTVFILALLAAGFLGACEDPVPNDYVPQIYAQAFFLVDNPIENIIVAKTQPVADSFDFDKSLIRDASLEVFENGEKLPGSFVFVNGRGYRYSDSNYLTKPNATYELKIALKDGAIVYGKTKTPGRIKWVVPPKKKIYYPKDTLNLPFVDSLTIEWSPVKGVEFYLLAIDCLDTLEYGKYLVPPSDEKNRRIFKPWAEEYFYKERKTWTFLPNVRTPVVWGIFKWYGLHQIEVMAPDENMLNWAKQYFIEYQYNPMFSSVSGGIGVVGSAAVVRDTFFLVKNRP